MAYMILHTDAEGRISVQVDTLADLYQIPSCAAGSYAYQSGCERFWEMSEDGVWIPGGAASSGGSSGGGGVFVVTFSMPDEDWVCDKTYAEIKAAFDAGKFIYGLVEQPDASVTAQLSLAHIQDSEDVSVARFLGPVYHGGSSIYISEYSVNADGVLTGIIEWPAN